MLPRVKSVGANLLTAAFCLFWPIFIGGILLPFGLILGVFLWPIGIWHLARGLSLKVESEFQPEAAPGTVAVEPTVTDDVRADNFSTALKWGESHHPGWPRSSQLEFASFLPEHFGERRWDGTNRSAEFSEAIDRWLEKGRREPKIFVDLTPVSTRDSFGHFELKQRFDQAPQSIISQRFKATVRHSEVGLVVLDRPKNEPTMVLYEVYVRPDRRGEGLGTAVVRTVEDLAWSEGRRRVLVRPYPLDPGYIDQEGLEAWYQRRGYQRVDESDVMWAKVLT